MAIKAKEIEIEISLHQLRRLFRLLEEAESINKKANELGWELCIRPNNLNIDYSRLTDKTIERMVSITS